jgi:hypothetical protein
MLKKNYCFLNEISLSICKLKAISYEREDEINRPLLDDFSILNKMKFI